MATIDPRLDAYIEKSAPFAKPILTHVRELVHATCPDVEETIKWSFPHFNYRGSTLCSIAAFKEHAAMTFWKAKLFDDPKGFLSEASGMGQLGKLTSLADLPSDKLLIGFIKQGMKLNEDGVKVPKRKSTAPIVTEVPDELREALAKNLPAKKTFEEFSPSNKREYIVWITEAKTEATRQKRLSQALEWMAEGKPRLWKYMK